MISKKVRSLKNSSEKREFIREFELANEHPSLDVNDILRLAYSSEGYEDVRTFNEWIKEGKCPLPFDELKNPLILKSEISGTGVVNVYDKKELKQ